MKLGLSRNKEIQYLYLVKYGELFPPVTTLNTGKYSYNTDEQFKYLGIIILKHNEIGREVAARKRTGN